MELEPPHHERVLFTDRRSPHEWKKLATRRGSAAGELERLRTSVRRPPSVPLDRLPRTERPRENRLRFLDHVLAAAATRKGEAVLSHYAALAVWDLPCIEPWPDSVDMLAPTGSMRRSRRGVRIHHCDVDAGDLHRWGEFWVTTPARTVADLARSGHFQAAVVALDFLLDPSNAGASDAVTKEQVSVILDRIGTAWGMARAMKAVEFADGRSGSPGESGSRVVIHELGFPIPLLQVHHRVAGRDFFTDFEWPAERRRRTLIGEFDGLGKYLGTWPGGGTDAGQVVIEEKRREDLLRGERPGNDVVRWGFRELRDPMRLHALLVSRGLTTHPRPRQSFVPGMASTNDCGGNKG